MLNIVDQGLCTSTSRVFIFIAAAAETLSSTRKTAIHKLTENALGGKMHDLHRLAEARTT